MKIQPTDGQPSKAQQAAYRGGQFAATCWPEVRQWMPEGATIGDHRVNCEADLPLSLSSDERDAFMRSFREGFNDEIARRAVLQEPAFVDAGEVLCAAGQKSDQRATETGAV